MARRSRGYPLSCWGWVALGCGTSLMVGVVLWVALLSEVRNVVADWGASDQRTSSSLAIGHTQDPGSAADQETYRVLLAMCLGVALSAAAGFRIFLPPLVLSISSRAGYVTMTPEWEAIFGSEFAVFVLLVASAVEIMAYYVPWLDNALDTVALPAAITAGTILTAACTTQMDPHLRWVFVVVAGSTQAGLMQTITATARIGSSVATGGSLNPMVATVETAGAYGLATVAVVAPLVAAPMAVIGTIGGIIYLRGRLLHRGTRRRVRQRMEAYRARNGIGWRRPD